MHARYFLVALGTIVAVALPTSDVLGQAADPIIGTWTLDLARSKFSPGPAPKSETRTYVVAGPDIKATSKTVEANGKTTTGAWTVNYDGKDRPETGNPDVDALALKKVDAYTTSFTEKRAGKVAITGTRVISKDGKTMTITTKGTDAKGAAIDNVSVFTKR
jgi:hypothetical protein